MLRHNWAGSLLAWCIGAGTLAAGALVSSPDETKWAATRQQTFEMVWSTVNEAYFDPRFGGVDWAAVRAQYEPRLTEAGDNPALRILLQQMLNELDRSHFAILPREAAVFTPEERVRIGTMGVEVGWMDDAVVVTHVTTGGPAEKAGLRPGAALRVLDGRDLHELLAAVQQSGRWDTLRAGRYLAQWTASHFRAAVGKRLKLRAQLSGGENEQEFELESVSYEGAWSEPVGNFPSWPLELASAVSTDGVAYLRFNVFARQVMKDIREFLLALPPGGGLVLDLRGNPGGLATMAPGITGWLTDRQLWLGRMKLRQGVMQFAAFPQEGAFTGPLAVLIDGTSASTAELMAAGLQETGRARIFGERSAGQALPSSFKQLPSGDLFQFAMADIVTPRGRSLEGAGVVPDEIVLRTGADLAAGRDSVLDAARAWLLAERAKISTGQIQTNN
ncbi:MAG: hypothetical protein HYV95_17090 [Opitutae bacterium]|nr:hypothetical protein [Opitutae bacterium]